LALRAGVRKKEEKEDILTSHAQVKAIAEQFFNALRTDNIGSLPLATDVEFTSVLQPEPIKGEPDVRAHLLDISPFILDSDYSHLTIENSAAAALTEFTTVNGVKSQGAYFLNVENGEITSIINIFDTRPLFKGSDR